MTEEVKANPIVEALKEADSPEAIGKIIKDNKRDAFVEAATPLGIAVETNDQKADIANKIIVVLAKAEDNEPESEAKTDGLPKGAKAPESVPDPALNPVQKALLKENHPVIQINDRIEAIPLDRKLGVLVIVDDDKIVHVPGCVINYNNKGPIVGRN